MNDTVRPVPIDFRAYVDDVRKARRESSPCETCGSPDPGRLFVNGCSDCKGNQIVVEDHGLWMLVAEVES